MAISQQGFAEVYFGDQGVEAAEVLGVPLRSMSLNEARKKAANLSITFGPIPDAELLNTPFLSENVILTWRMGLLSDKYGPDGERPGVELNGTYIIKTVGLSYNTDGSIDLQLQAYDRSIQLSDPTPRAFTQKRADEIAAIIAESMGLRFEGLPSNIVHKHVVTGDLVTAGQRLRSLADDEDFEFYVENDVLYFVPTPREGRVDVELAWAARNDAVDYGIYVQSFKSSIEAAAAAGADKRKSAGKGDDGKPNSSNAKQDDADAAKVDVTYQVGGGYTKDVRLASLAYNIGEMNEASPLKDGATLDARNISKRRQLAWKKHKCSGVVFGYLLRPRQVIRVIGTSARDSCPWMVTEVRTTYDTSGDITQSFSGITDPGEHTNNAGKRLASELGTTAAASAASAKASKGGPGARKPRRQVTYQVGGGYTQGAE